ncbi:MULTISPECIES: hypothetical protein [Methylorubrum]|uniref:hypothetical protein n=1 Tax=Methylorubrum TaxID=2282523 RepID=UPI00209DD8B1|nr:MULTISPECIES: hypothetical protein [Methylorubrum]MCP1550662.1 hypothetical protein [Methylorubrum zatmanii]MCP1552725.1 hypothetical protein [Methylorubrum extorquens]MCP1580965.1 hypothetical protein [Methylorubrum extorquens]
MSENAACSLTVERGASGCASLTIDLGECEAVIDLPHAETRKLIRALSAALGDGFERTHGTEASDA